MGPESTAGAPPGLAEAQGWVGCELDDASGSRVGRVEGLYADAEGGGPVWLVIALAPRGGRLRLGRGSARTTVVPLHECAAMPGRVWSAQGSEAIRAAPAVDPTRPLLREHEAAISAHYGIGERVGRHAEIAARPANALTALPS